MGWWKTGNNDDIVGDDPADSMVGTLLRHAEAHGVKPTFQELIDVTADLVHRKGELFLADPRPVEIVAVFKPPAPALRSREVTTGALTSSLMRVYEEIAGQYLYTGHARKPRLTELLEVLRFVLHVEPERFLREVEGHELEELRLEPLGERPSGGSSGLELAVGWWRTGNDDDVIGDDPADAIIEALENYADVHEVKRVQIFCASQTSAKCR